MECHFVTLEHFEFLAKIHNGCQLAAHFFFVLNTTFKHSSNFLTINFVSFDLISSRSFITWVQIWRQLDHICNAFLMSHYMLTFHKTFFYILCQLFHTTEIVQTVPGIIMVKFERQHTSVKAHSPSRSAVTYNTIRKIDFQSKVC